MFAFNLVTDSLDNYTFNTKIIGLSFAILPSEYFYIPIEPTIYNSSLEKPSDHMVLAHLKPLFEDKNMLKVCQNLKYTRNVLKNYDIYLEGSIDIILESYALNSIAGGYDLESLAARWLDLPPITSIKKINKHKQKKRNTINNFLQEKKIHDSARYAEIILQLHLKIWPTLQKQKGPSCIFQQIELPLVSVISRIERHGVLIDKNILLAHSLEMNSRLEKIKLEAYELAGEFFNLSSPKQLQTILFKKHGIQSKTKTPRGALSTSEEVLSKLSLNYPLPKLLLEYRYLTKLKSNYTDKLPQMINPHSGRIHTSYHQTITVTGRLSSSNPNLQNIPVRNYEGRRIRQAFIAPYGYRILAADYSQIELRIIAHLSNDKGLLKAFASDQDVHCATAAEVFGITINTVSNEQRRYAKVINFGLLYGMSAFGLSRRLNISINAAKKYIDIYFKRYPAIKKYFEKTRHIAREKGYVSSVYGRRLYLPDINSSNLIRRKAAERAAINAPIQGTAADIIKRAMIAIDKWLYENKDLKVKIIMQVHDELVFEVQENIINIVSDKISYLMREAIKISVPLKVDIGVGKNWDEAH